MSMAATSHSYTVGTNTMSLPHYHVELTHAHLLEFEMLNSMSALESFDQLLYFFESKLASNNLPVPPGDVIIVMLTLATVSEHYKGQLLRNNDPYNVSRNSLSVRSVRVLQQLVQKMVVFDTRNHSIYDLELLRCQFFIAIDHISPKRPSFPLPKKDVDSYKRRKTSSSRVECSEHAHISSGVNSNSSNFNNSYSSYVSALEHKTHVLKNSLLTIKLNQRGGFWNCVGWALANSVEESFEKYSCGRIWMPVLHIIFQLYDLRQEYFMNFEFSKAVRPSLCFQQLEDSPLALVFGTLSLTDCKTILCDYLFVNCQYPLAGKISVHPVYQKETSVSPNYISSANPTRVYKLKQSMKLRRAVLASFFKLLFELPGGQKLHSLKVNEKEFIKHMSRILKSFENLDEFKCFFYSSDFSKDIDYLSLLAEECINEIAQDLGHDLRLSIIDSLGDENMFIAELIEIFETGFPRLDYEIYSGDWNTLEKCIAKCDICLIVLIKYAINIHGETTLKMADGFDRLLELLIINDKDRVLHVQENFDTQVTPPKLYPILTILFHSG